MICHSMRELVSLCSSRVNSSRRHAVHTHICFVSSVCRRPMLVVLSSVGGRWLSVTCSRSGRYVSGCAAEGAGAGCSRGQHAAAAAPGEWWRAEPAWSDGLAGARCRSQDLRGAAAALSPASDSIRPAGGRTAVWRRRIVAALATVYNIGAPAPEQWRPVAELHGHMGDRT